MKQLCKKTIGLFMALCLLATLTTGTFVTAFAASPDDPTPDPSTSSTQPGEEPIEEDPLPDEELPVEEEPLPDEEELPVDEEPLPDEEPPVEEDPLPDEEPASPAEDSVLPNNDAVSFAPAGADDSLLVQPQALNNPSNFTAAKGTTGITLKWTAAPGASYYILLRASTRAYLDDYINNDPALLSGNDCKSIILSAPSTATTLQYPDTGLADKLGAIASNKKYSYALCAADIDESSGTLLDISSIVYTAAVPQPASPKATGVAYSKIKVSFTKISGASGYEVWRSSSKDSGYSKLKTLPASTASWTFGPYQNSKLYYFKVRAYCTEGGKTYYGSWTSPVSARAKALAAPSSRNATGVLYNKIKVTYSKVTGASGYEIWRSSSKSSGYKKLKTLSASATAAKTFGPYQTGKLYYFKVRAYRTINGTKYYGAWTSPVSSRPKALAAPANFKASAYNYDYVKLSWSKKTGANGYYIYRSTSKNGTYTKIKTITGSSTTTYKNKITNGKKYYYKIAAYRTISGKKYAATLTGFRTGTTKKLAPIEAESIPYAYNESGQILISWPAISGATGYIVYYQYTQSYAPEKLGTTTTNAIWDTTYCYYGGWYTIVPYRHTTSGRSFNDAKWSYYIPNLYGIS